MEVFVDGSRSSNEHWLHAHEVPVQMLPRLTEDQRLTAEQMAIPDEEYSRLEYAAELTKKDLQMRASRVGELVDGWLRKHRIAGEVRAVSLKTLEGQFRVTVEAEGESRNVVLREEIVDDALDAGSLGAKQSLDRALSMNFLKLEAAWAS